MAKLVVIVVLVFAMMLSGCAAASKVADRSSTAADFSLGDWFDDHPVVKYTTIAGVTVLVLVGIGAIVLIVGLASSGGPQLKGV